nr:putative invertase inhibitor [Ipomoea batatas]
MDSLTNVSIIITTVLCVLTMVSTTTANPNLTLIQKACDDTNDHKLCLDYLSKSPQVVSAAQKSPLALAAAIAEAGLADARRMRGYASEKSVKSPAVKSAYAECAKSVDDTVAQLEIAVNILNNPARVAKEGGSDDASYSLMVSVDGLTACSQTLASVKVEDRYIKTSVKRVEVCGVAANSIVIHL